MCGVPPRVLYSFIFTKRNDIAVERPKVLVITDG